ncbi:unnamed protein product, partial [Prorocentrum cordatum]
MERAHRVVIVGFPRKMMKTSLVRAAELFIRTATPTGETPPVIRAFDMTKKVTLDFLSSQKASDFLANLAPRQPLRTPDPVHPAQEIELRAKRDMEPGTRLLFLAMGKVRGAVAAATRSMLKEVGSNGLGGDIFLLRKPEDPVLVCHLQLVTGCPRNEVAIAFFEEQFAEFHAVLRPLVEDLKKGVEHLNVG